MDSMNTVLAILGTLVTVVSFGYAIYVNRKLAKISFYNREQAWDIYRQASGVLAAYQKLEKMKIENVEAISLISKAEAEAKELTLNSMKMIKRFEKIFSQESIDKWVKEGRLDTHESHIQAFKKLIDSE